MVAGLSHLFFVTPLSRIDVLLILLKQEVRELNENLGLGLFKSNIKI